MVGGGGIDAANTAADHVDAMKKALDRLQLTGQIF